MSALGAAFPLVISAPSGAGKTSLARAMIQRNADVVFSVSATTRPAREYERPGVDYYFHSDAEFDRMLQAGELLEWAVVHDSRYGTPRAAVERAIGAGNVVTLDIDVQGARQVRSSYPAAVLVFVLPPSASELARRLVGRGTEAAAQQQNRLRTARAEMDAAAEFDYVIVNDDFDTALSALEAIVRAERHRSSRADTLPAFIERMENEINTMIEGAES